VAAVRGLPDISAIQRGEIANGERNSDNIVQRWILRDGAVLAVQYPVQFTLSPPFYSETEERSI